MKPDNRIITATPTVSTTAYAANDNVGGRIALGAVTVPSKIQSVTVIDRSAQAAALEILLLEKSPNASTITDNAAPTWNTAEVGNIIARIPVASADYAAAINGVRVANLSNLQRMVKGTDLTAILVTSGTPTYALGALTLKFGIET